MIQSYFTSGAAIAVILALMALEAVLLMYWMKRISPPPLLGEVVKRRDAEKGLSTAAQSGRAVMANAMLLGLAAGAAMVLALGAATMQYGYEVVGAFLALSFVIHLVEVRLWLNLAKRLPA